MRRVIAGLRLGCLPLAVEVGRYTGTPYLERACRLCGTGEMEGQHHFEINCPSLTQIRQKLFMHCNSSWYTEIILLLISVNFSCVTQMAQQCSLYTKCKNSGNQLYITSITLSHSKEIFCQHYQYFNDLCNPCTQIMHRSVTSKSTLAGQPLFCNAAVTLIITIIIYVNSGKLFPICCHQENDWL